MQKDATIARVLTETTGPLHQPDFFIQACKCFPFGVFFMNEKKEILYSNPLAHQILGNEFQNNIESVLHPQDLMLFRAGINSVLEGEPEFKTHFQILNTKGKRKWISFSFSAISGSTEPYFIGVVNDVTQEKEEQLKLLQDQDDFNALLQSLDDVIIEMDEDLKFTKVWTRDPSSLWAKPEFFIGKTMKDISNGEDTSANELLIRKAAITGIIQEREFQSKNYPDGRWFNARYSPVLVNGMPNGKTLIVVRDITARKKAEIEANTRKQNMALLLKASNDAFWEHNLETDEHILSDRWFEMLGYEPGEIQLKENGWHKVIFSADIEKVIQAREKLMKGESDNFYHEIQMVHKKGHLVPVISRGLIMRDENGKPLKIAGGELDISKLKEAEANRQKYQDRLELIVKASNDGFWERDFEANTEWISDRWFRQFGYEPGEIDVYHYKWMELIHPDDINIIHETTRKLHAGETDSYSDEVRIRHKDGHYITVISRGLVLRDETGKPIKMAGGEVDISKLKEAETNRQKYQDRLELIVKASNDGFWERDYESNSKWTSDRWYKQFGYEPGEIDLSHDEWRKLIHPEDKEKVNEITQLMLSGESDSYTCEVRVMHKDGHYVPVISRGLMLRDQNGKPVKIAGGEVDISDLKREIEKTKEKQELLHQVVSASNDGIWNATVATGETYLSPRWKEIFGFEDHELPNTFETWKGRIHPDDFESANREYQKVLSGEKEGYTLEQRYLHRNGNVVHVLSRLGVLKNEKGEVEKVVGALINITDLKTAEEKLVKNNRLLKLISESQTEHFLDENIELTAKKMLSALCETTGSNCGFIAEVEVHEDKKYLFAHATSSVVPEKEENEFLKALKRGKINISPDDILLSNPVWKGEPILLNSFTPENAGNYYSFDPELGNFISLPIISEGKLLGITTLGKSKEGYNEETIAFLQPFISTYATLIKADRAHKSRLKAEQDLIQAKEIAEDAARTRTEFLSMMSHEIRTPLNAILGVSHLMTEEEGEGVKDEKLNILKFSSQNLLSIINDILDFNKIEAGKIQLEHTHFNLRQLIKGIIQANTPRSEDNRNTIKLFFDENLPPILLGDPVRLGQILNNLVSNATKFTHDGKIRIEVLLKELRNQKAWIGFSVSDSGIGIPEEMREKIFDSFTQASSDTTRKFGGTGLGLSITKKLVNLFGSEIFLESELGVGSTFSFDLTLEVDSHNSISESSPPQILNWNQLKGKKLLVAEDNVTNVMLIKMFLEKWGVQFQIAGNGMDALRLAEGNNFDLILMDLQMPIMDGYEATRKIREIHPQIPVIALTAAAMLDEREKATLAGMNDYVTKPFNPGELFRKILNCLNAVKIQA